jgi:NADPH:quinone reductase
MRAIVIEQAGGPEVLQLRNLPTPEPREDWVLIRVKAFGLNRSELYTRQGNSPDVKFPRVPGIECVGTVEAAPGTNLQPGQTVAAIMGGMGRAFDGGYAEYTLVPAKNVIPLQTTLPWDQLGALPETYLTAWGSLIGAMDMQEGQSLLVRGATSSVGMAAISFAKGRNLTVLATTRNQAKVNGLRAAGADYVIIDNGQKLSTEVKNIVAGGVNGVLELVATRDTLLDSLQALAPKGIVCVTGALGNVFALDGFSPLAAIPTGARLTAFASGTITSENGTPALQEIADGIASGRYKANVDHTFHFNEIVEAHRYMEENRALGKVVVLVD